MLVDKEYPSDAHVTSLIQAERLEQGYQGPGPEDLRTNVVYPGLDERPKERKGLLTKKMQRALEQDEIRDLF